MDFLALPRRDLQALCKRNGVRANMTNVAMADALRALPKVDGIEEYVKQPGPVAKAAVAEEKNAGKQGNPLPRGRRVVAKSSAPIEPEEANEEEKGNAKRQASMEDAPALGVGRRGASRRAGLVPVVPQLAAMAEQALKREAKREKAPAPVVGRRGASRRARPSRAVAAQAAESEAAGAEEEQREEEVEDPKREATVDDVPALGVGRRGASRRARPAPSVAAMAGKVVAEEEQRAQIGRCVRAKGTSSEPITLDDSDDEKMEDAKPEEQQEDAQILGVGRRGRASRRAPAASEAPVSSRSAAATKSDAGDVAVEAVVPRATRQRKPTMKAAAAAAAAAVAEEEAPRKTLRRGAAMSTLLQQGVQEEPQEDVDAPDMAVEAVPIRPTRQRKPTMKAAAAEEKAPRRATRRGGLEQEIQEQPQDVVITEDEKMTNQTPAENSPVTTCVMPENPTALDEDRDKPNEVVIGDMSHITVTTCTAIDKVPELELIGDVFVQADHVVAAENLPKQDSEIIVEDTSLQVDVMQQSKVTMDEDVAKDYSEIDGLHSNEQMEVVTIDKVPELDLNEDAFVQADHVVAAENLAGQVIDSEIIVEATSLLVDEKQQSTVTLDEDVVKIYSETEGIHSNEQMEVITTDKVPELELIEGVFDQADHVVAVVNLPEQVIDCEIILETTSLIVDGQQKSTVKTDDHADEQMEVATTDEVAELTETDDEGVEEMKTPPIVDEKQQNTVTLNEDIVADHFNTHVAHADEQKEVVATEVPEVTRTDSEIEDKTPLIVDEKQSTTTNANVVFDHFKTDIAHADEQKEVTGIVTEVLDEVTRIDDEVVVKVPELKLIEDVFVQADHVVAAENLPKQVIDSEIIVEDTSLLVDVMQQSTVTMDEDVVKDYSATVGVHSNEQMEVITIDKVPELKLIEDVFVQADHVVAAENLPKQVIDSKIIVEDTSLLVDEMQQSTVTMDEDVVKENSETDRVHSNEQMEVVTTDKVPELELIEDVFDQADHVATVVNLPEQRIDCEIILETTSLIVDQKQKSTVTMDIDVVNDHFKTDEQMEVATSAQVAELTETDDEGGEGMKIPPIVDEKQQRTVTSNGDIVDDHFKTNVAHADEQKEVVATEVPEVTGTDSETEDKTPVIADEKKQSITTNGNVVFDHFQTDIAHADEQKEVTGIVTEVIDEGTGIKDEVVEENAVVITEDILNQGTVPSVTNTLDGCAKENHFGIHSGHGNEQNTAITADIEPDVSRAQDGGAREELALLDDVTESMSKSIITMEPSVCKSNSGKDSAEPIAVLKEKGVKVASKSEDLTKLSLGQLRAKLKEKLNAKKNKEAKKRVALARVDENVCRSHAKGQQQDLNLQQH